MREGEAERQERSQERPVPAEEMRGGQPVPTGCLAMKRLPWNRQCWERGGHKVDQSEYILILRGSHLPRSQPHPPDYNNDGIEADQKLKWLKHKRKNQQTPRQEGSHEDKVVSVLKKTATTEE